MPVVDAETGPGQDAIGDGSTIQTGPGQQIEQPDPAQPFQLVGGPQVADVAQFRIPSRGDVFQGTVEKAAPAAVFSPIVGICLGV